MTLGSIGICLKIQVYNVCVLPAMTYGAETWAAAAQTKMERGMLNSTYRDRKTNIWVREKAKVTDVFEHVRRRKWTWAGHVTRVRNNRWTLRIITRKPYKRKRQRKTGDTLERRTRRLLEGYHLAGDSADLEAAC